MKSFEYTIKDELGIHARPAGLLVKCVKSTGSVVKITKDDKTVEGTKLMALMGMGVKCGDTLRISVEGEDEDIAYETVKKFFEENL
ncbi:MAG: HPr family phosphocarrier protein [Lachnospiraceae bacterium]